MGSRLLNTSMSCRISPITKTLRYNSSVPTEDNHRMTLVSARRPLRGSETTLVSRRKFKTRL